VFLRFHTDTGLENTDTRIENIDTGLLYTDFEVEIKILILV